MPPTNPEEIVQSRPEASCEAEASCEGRVDTRSVFASPTPAYSSSFQALGVHHTKGDTCLQKHASQRQERTIQPRAPKDRSPTAAPAHFFPAGSPAGTVIPPHPLAGKGRGPPPSQLLLILQVLQDLRAGGPLLKLLPTHWDLIRSY